MESNGQQVNEGKGGAAPASVVTVGDLRERESDVLYAFVLLFTFGQMVLIVWDMLSMVRGFPELAAFVGIREAGRIQPFGEMTTLYLGLVGAYIGRNAYQKYKGKEDAEEVPRYLFLRIKRGYFYMALWATLCFVAYMLKGFGEIYRLPDELTVTTLGVLGGLIGDKAIKRFLDKRSVRQLEAADTVASHRDAILGRIDKTGWINNKECRDITGLSDAQAARVLAQLVQEGKLNKKGDGKDTFYEKA